MKVILTVCLLFLLGSGVKAQENVNARTVYGKGVVHGGTNTTNSTGRIKEENQQKDVIQSFPVSVKEISDAQKKENIPSSEEQKKTGSPAPATPITTPVKHKTILTKKTANLTGIDLKEKKRKNEK